MKFFFFQKSCWRIDMKILKYLETKKIQKDGCIKINIAKILQKKLNKDNNLRNKLYLREVPVLVDLESNKIIIDLEELSKRLGT